MNKNLLIVAWLLSVGMLTTGKVLASNEDGFTIDNQPELNKTVKRYAYGQYEGEVNNRNMRHGKGTMTYFEGSGGLREGAMEYSEGKSIYKIYEYIPDVREYGGGTYKGDWVNDKRVGKGIMTYVNKDRYEGDWNNDEKNGKGKMVYKNGDVYEGDWRKSKMKGQGTMVYSNGDKYDGSWDYDMKENGRMVYRIGGSVYEGAFKNDKRGGNGKMIYGNASGYGGIYTGNWDNCKREGFGTYEIVYWRSKPAKETNKEEFKPVKKIIFKGNWKNDEFLGKPTEEEIVN
jgi:hypothetical protein